MVYVYAIGHAAFTGLRPQLVSHVVCVLVCAAVVGAGFGILLGLGESETATEGRDIASELSTTNNGAGSGGAEAQGSKAGVTVDEGSGGSVSPSDVDPDGERSGGASSVGEEWLLASFIMFVVVLLALGICWSYKLVVWRRVVSEYSDTVSVVTCGAVPQKSQGGKKIPEAFAPDIGNRFRLLIAYTL